ncbi:MAG: hypothetical protein K0R20_2506 [Actinomycetia bacterium]|jgi:ketosteroid isomerase-like protein|nr:hypothetical protein [Actinomycetes bacterium]
MSQENVEIAQEIVGAWAEGDFFSGATRFAPHAVLVVPREFVEFGVYVGEDRIRDYTLRFMGQYERLFIEATDFRAAGDTVVVSVVQHGRGRTSGIEMQAPYYILFTFRAGMIVRMESFIEEARALEAAGLSE